MKRTPSALARTLERPAVIKVTPRIDDVRRPERLFARIVLFAFAALAIAIVTACETTGTQFKGVWVSPEKGRTPVKSVLVIGVNGDATARRIYEDAIVAQLAAHGTKARVSYDLLPELGPAPPPGIGKVVRAVGVDAVLVSRTLRTSTDIRVTPGYSHGGPWDFQRMWHDPWSVPPNIQTVERVDVESQLFDAKEFALVWSGSSTTEPSSSMQQSIGDFAKLLVKALADAKVIA
jgi:hypothetical protein